VFERDKVFHVLRSFPGMGDVSNEWIVVCYCLFERRLCCSFVSREILLTMEASFDSFEGCLGLSEVAKRKDVG
jgi:hypothetical protein